MKMVQVLIAWPGFNSAERSDRRCDSEVDHEGSLPGPPASRHYGNGPHGRTVSDGTAGADALPRDRVRACVLVGT